MEGSRSSVWGISFRISAESSTTSTRILRLMPSLLRGTGFRKLGDERGHVQNQHYGSIAQNRRPADQRRRDQLIFERFDNQFFFAHQPVHHQAEAARARPDYNHKSSFGCSSRDARPQLFQPHQRQNLVPQLKDLPVLNAMNLVLR